MAYERYPASLTSRVNKWQSLVSAIKIWVINPLKPSCCCQCFRSLYFGSHQNSLANDWRWGLWSLPRWRDTKNLIMNGTLHRYSSPRQSICHCNVSFRNKEHAVWLEGCCSACDSYLSPWILIRMQTSTGDWESDQLNMFGKVHKSRYKNMGLFDIHLRWFNRKKCLIQI